MTTDNFCFYFQNSQTGGQQYSDTFAFSIPCKGPPLYLYNSVLLLLVLKAEFPRNLGQIDSAPIYHPLEEFAVPAGHQVLLKVNLYYTDCC